MCKGALHLSSFHRGHVVARAKGGSDSIENLTTLCQSCNTSMGAMDVLTYVRTRFGDGSEQLLRIHQMIKEKSIPPEALQKLIDSYTAETNAAPGGAALPPAQVPTAPPPAQVSAAAAAPAQVSAAAAPTQAATSPQAPVAASLEERIRVAVAQSDDASRWCTEAYNIMHGLYSALKGLYAGGCASGDQRVKKANAEIKEWKAVVTIALRDEKVAAGHLKTVMREKKDAERKQQQEIKLAKKNEQKQAQASKLADLFERKRAQAAEKVEQEIQRTEFLTQKIDQQRRIANAGKTQPTSNLKASAPSLTQNKA